MHLLPCSASFHGPCHVLGPEVLPGGELVVGGDVVIAVDGAEVLSIQELARIIDLHDVGDEIVLTVLRDGKLTEVLVTLLEWPGV